jgi:uncharacterized protein (TIGR03437 family)
MWISILFICAAVSAEAQIISTIAGSKWVFPTAPLPAVQAPLGHLFGVAVDNAGSYYVADPSNNLVLKVNASGTLNTVAGNGSSGYSGDGGPATSAALYGPYGVAVDGAGNLFIADTRNERIRKVNTAGIITTVAGNGTYGYSGDGGPATSAALYDPYGVAVDGAGNLYIADTGNERIRKVNTAGIITTVAGKGTYGYSGDGGPATSAALYGPYGVAVDGAGNLYIADQGNNRIRMVGLAGIITTVAGNGTHGYSGDGGPATSAELYAPEGVAVDNAGDLLIADTGNNRIRQVKSGGTVSTVAGNGIDSYSGDGGLATSASLVEPSGVAVDSAGNLYIADSYSERVRKVTPHGVITTVAGDGAYGYGGDGGPAAAASLSLPSGVAADGAGNVFIADILNNRIRQVNPGGTISTVAGNGIQSYSGDGGPATSAELFWPGGVAVDNAGNLFIADTVNDRIRKVSGGTITTVAGNGTYGYSGDGGPATSAELRGPSGIAVDNAGNLFIADAANSVIRLVNPAGTITTVAGNGTLGYSGDGGPATHAQLNQPSGVAVGNAGNLFIADAANSVIRLVNPAGTITTVAGNGTCCYSGDGGPATSAELRGPSGIAVDNAGNLFIADTGNQRIRLVNASGIITTVAVTLRGGFSGDGGPATSAELQQPYGVAVDAAGDLLIADSGNNRIREVPRVLTAPATVLSAASGTAPVAPGSIVSIYGSSLATIGTSATIIPLPTNLGGTSVTITDSSGATAALPLFYAGPTQINAEIPQTASTGTATLTITTPSGTQTASVMLAAVAPGLFAANQNGKGVSAAQLVTNQSNGQQTVVDIFNAPCAAGSCVGIPLDVSSGNTALVLFGTGIQNRASLSDVTVTVGSQTLPAAYAGPAPGFTGLDQVNVLLPASLAGSGTVNITVSVSGTASNVVTATFQ